MSVAVSMEGLEEASILVVDDQQTNRLLLGSYLRQGGFRQVRMARDGQEALDAVAERLPDLILLDLVMPGIEGFEVCRRLRSQGHRDLPIIVQTALNESDDRRRAFVSGATDFVIKPVHPQELLARVRVHLGRGMRLRELTEYRTRRARELALARRVHERVLPAEADLKAAESRTGLRIQEAFAPSQELGGDFWVLRVDAAGRLVLWFVDFSGHGISAAVHALQSQGVLRALPLEGFDPAAELGRMNAALKAVLPTGTYATVLTAVVDRAAGWLIYASAGAPAPLLVRPGGNVEVLAGGGLPAGIAATARYSNRSVPFPAGTTLVLASDGVTEAETPEGLLGDEGLARHVAAAAMAADGLRIERLLAGLRQAVRFTDDVSALVVTSP